MTWQPCGNDGTVIVGGGLAGQRCAESLRRNGYDGSIRIVCAEPHPPYDRPPLSKDALAGSHPVSLEPRSANAVSYRSSEWYEDARVDLLLGVSAVELRPAENQVELSDGGSLHYHRLLIATGSRPRMLPMLERYCNVSTLRTLDDCWQLSEVLGSRPRLAVIGAGFIGQEVAATARRLGCEVTIVEAAPTPLAAILGCELGAWFARLHRAEGVEVLTDTRLECACGNGAVEELRLSTGRTLRVDHVLVGIGVIPNCEWLSGSGLNTEAGVRVDAHGRTELDGVLAVGDAAATLDPRAGRHIPGSHWEAAARQGATAARVMLGIDPGVTPVSSFWTDQYGIRIQYLGHAPRADAIELDGDPDRRSFTATFTRAGRPVAALLVNRPRSLPAARESIEKGTT
jgi:3-phenylpropionate/trans-cinnamate dioxygenase ferredoxin reductase component